MATISSPGIGSGLDVNSIITQLMAIEQQPVTELKTKASKIQIRSRSSASSKARCRPCGMPPRP